VLLVHSGVRDFGPAGPLFLLPQNYLTVCWRGSRLQLQMKMASLTLVGTEGIFCLLTDRMAPCPVLPLWPEGYTIQPVTQTLPSGTTLKLTLVGQMTRTFCLTLSHRSYKVKVPENREKNKTELLGGKSNSAGNSFYLHNLHRVQ